MAFECMDDCIHLKACRRIQKIGRTHRLMVPRYCTNECSCYASRNEEVAFMSHYDAERYAERVKEDGYAKKSNSTLGEIIDELDGEQ